MTRVKHRRKKIYNGQWQLNAIGIFLCLLLWGSGWWLWQQPKGFTTLLPLLLIGYTSYRVIFELTLNRHNLPTLATSRAARKRIAALLVQDAARCEGKNYTMVDLGSGRGELSRRIAKAIPQGQMIGIESAFVPYIQSSLVQKLFGPGNLTYRHMNFWPYDCSTAQAVLLYLNQRLAKKAGEKLRKEMKRGTLAISYNFPLLGEWEPIETIIVRTPFRETIYVYRRD